MTIIQALKKLFGLDGDYGTIAAALDDAEIDSGLPAVTTDDNGDILKVVEGAWAKGDPPGGLPAVTAADNKKGLCVSNGEWVASKDVVVLDGVQNSSSILGYSVPGFDSVSSKWKKTSTVLLPYDNNAPKGKTISTDPTTGHWQFAPAMPIPTAADAGKIVKVNSAGDGYELVSA